MIKKKGSKYWLDFRIGKRRYRRSLGTDEQGLALDRAREIKKKLIEEKARKDITLQDFAKEYMAWAWIQKPSSARDEDYRLTKLLKMFQEMGIEYLADVKPYHVEQIRGILLRENLSKKDGKERFRSRATVNRYCQLLRGLFYRAIDWEKMVGPNPVKKIKFYRENPIIKPLSKEDIGKVLAAAREIASEPLSSIQRIIPDLIELAIHTGLRKSELLNLRWRNLRDEEIEVIGKGERKRSVPLNRMARTIIMRQPRSGEFIFDIPNRHQTDLLRRTIKQIRKRSGVPFNLHLCRHYCATELLAKGVDIVTIAEILGHSRSSISLIYSHTDPARKRQAVALLES